MPDSGRHRLFTLAALLFASGLAPAVQAADAPNIVFMLADDMGYGDPGCYNAESKIPTPNLDRLAREGMRLTDAHSPSAVCTPTRYGVLTGRYCWRTSLKSGVLWGFSPCLLEPARMTVAALLKEHGYRTACVGKWHLGLGDRAKTDYSQPLAPGPVTSGFDHFFGIPASLDMEPYVYVLNDRPLEQPTEMVAGSKMRRQGGGGFWRAGPIAPSFKHIDVLPRTTAEAVSFLERHQQTAADQPFFLYLPFSAPHTPWLPAAKFAGKSGAGPYGDFAMQVDHAVGQVLATLDELKLADDTLVIFTSDNGAHWLPSDIEKYGHRANAHLRGQKADIHEGGHRVPFLARWPGRIKAGAVSEQLATHTDLFATVAELVGAELPPAVADDSYSLAPALLGRKATGPVREAAVHHSLSGMFAIRRGPWKLVEGLGTGGFTAPRSIKPQSAGPQGQLYHLARDPGETSNLWLDEPAVVAELTALLKQYREQGHSRPIAAASAPQ